MKRFIISMSLFFGGLFIICSTIIADGLRVCGNNAYSSSSYSLLSGNDIGSSITLIVIGTLLAIAGLVSAFFLSAKDR